MACPVLYASRAVGASARSSASLVCLPSILTQHLQTRPNDLRRYDRRVHVGDDGLQAFSVSLSQGF